MAPCPRCSGTPRVRSLQRAEEKRPVYFGLLMAGVLFLDEIPGELGLDEQAMLLRALEEDVSAAPGSDRRKPQQFSVDRWGQYFDLFSAVPRGSLSPGRPVGADEQLSGQLFTSRSAICAPEDIDPNLPIRTR